MDRYFLVLRLGSAVAALVWVAAFVDPEALAQGVTLTAVFVGYSAALYAYVWRNPERRAAAYLAVMPVDLVVLFLLCLWSAEPMSAIYLAFYLVVALHAFYFGPSVGITAAAGFAALYLLLYFSIPPDRRCPPEELSLRVGFAFLVAVSLGLVSRQLSSHRRHLLEANRALAQRNLILEQTYRHLSLGRLAGGVAHHINNPAAAIMGKAELIRRRAEREGLAKSYIEDATVILDNSFRIGKVTRSLIALAQPHEGPVRNLDLARVTESMILLFESRAAERRISIERRLEPGLRVNGPENFLREVIVNLLANALDAVDEGGTVAVETRAGSNPDTIELRISDNGQGIPPEQLDEIFSPFFTTKYGSDGVGLGLTQSLTAARRLGGTIEVESTPGAGSTFTVVLPRYQKGVGVEEGAQ